MEEQAQSSGFNVLLGIVLLCLAAGAGYWLFETIVRLWNEPAGVPLVKIFIDSAKENSKVLTPSGEITIPQYVPVAAGVFFCILIIGAVAGLVRALLQGACNLLLPEGMPMLKRLKADIETLNASVRRP